MKFGSKNIECGKPDYTVLSEILYREQYNRNNLLTLQD